MPFMRRRGKMDEPSSDDDEMPQSVDQLWMVEDEDLRRDIASARLGQWTRTVNARFGLVAMAKQVWRKVYDEKHGSYYYSNGRTGEVVWTKPRQLRNDDAPDDLDLEREVAQKVGDFKKRLQAEYLIERKQAARDAVVNARANKSAKSAKKAPKALGVPEAPINVACAALNGSASVWWTPMHDHGTPAMLYIVRHYRRDHGEFKHKGNQRVTQTAKGVSNFVLPECRVMHLHNECNYRFTVCAVNANGTGPDSEPSNTVRPDRELPENWMMELDQTTEHFYYFNKLTGQRQWESPEKDPFYTKTAHWLDLTELERAGLRTLWDTLDVDHEGEISTSQLEEIFLKMGEVVVDLRRAELLEKHCAPRRVPQGTKPIVKWDEFLGMVGELKMMKGHEPIQGLHLLKRAKRKLDDRKHEKARPKISGDVHLLGNRDAEKKWGAWMKKQDEVIQQTYYVNRDTKERVWEMPPEVKFYLPPALGKKVKKTFSEAELADIKHQFEDYDLNHSGSIDEDEMRVIFDALAAETGDPPILPDDLRLLFEEADLDGSGQVEFDEFVLMVRAVEKMRGKKTGLFAMMHHRSKKHKRGKKSDFFNDLKAKHHAKVGVVAVATPGAGGAGSGDGDDDDATAAAADDDDDGNDDDDDDDEEEEEEEDDEEEDDDDDDSSGTAARARRKEQNRLKAEKARAKEEKRKHKRLSKGQRRELELFPHGRTCFCGCRAAALQGQKKKEGGAIYIMDDGRWRKEKKRGSTFCVIQ